MLLLISAATLLTLASVSDPHEALGQVFEAFRGSNYRYGAALLVIFLVSAFRRHGAKIKFLSPLTSGRWAVPTAIVLSALGALATKAVSNVPMGGVLGTLSTLLEGAFVGAGAAGLVRGAQKLPAPKPATTPPADPTTTNE